MELLYCQTYLNAAVNLLHSQNVLIMAYSGASLIWAVWDNFFVPF